MKLSLSILLGLLLAISTLSAQPLRKGEWARDTDDYFPGMEAKDAAGRQTSVVTRIVDEVTGRPLPGAVMHALVEGAHPISGEFQPDLTARADDQGWVRMELGRLAGKIDWWFFDAPGYGPRAEFGSLVDCPITLRKGVDVPVEVRGPMGRPAPDVGVGLILGCGHTPDVIFVRTEASGQAILPEIDPESGELWIIKPGLHGDYEDVDWAPAAPPITIWADPGPVVEGTILDEVGRPLEGAYVGAIRCHRGPWARTDAKGNFVLCGADPRSDLHIYHPRWGEELAAYTAAPPPGFRRILKLLPPGEEYGDVEGDIEWSFLVTDEEGAPLEEIRVQVVRAEDGFTDWRRTDTEGELIIPVHPGQSTVIIGEELDRYRSWQFETLVEEGTQLPQVIALTANPSIPVKLKGFPEEGRISLVSPTAIREVSQEIAETGAVAMPADGDLVLRLGHGGRVKVVPVTPAQRQPDAGPVVIEWYPPIQVSARVRDAEGRPVACWAFASRDVDPSGLEGRRRGAARSDPRVTVDEIGSWYLHAVPQDPKLSPAVRPFHVSGLEEGSLRLGDLVCHPAGVPRLRVSLPDGRPAAHADLYIAQMGGAWQTWTRLEEMGELPPGRSNLATGALVRVTPEEKEGLLPLLTRLEGPGPWDLRWPRAALDLAVSDFTGLPCKSFTLVLDGSELDGARGRLEIEGLDPGPHSLVIWAPGHRARVYHLELEEELRHLEIKLSARDG